MTVLDDSLKNVEPANRKQLERIRKIVHKTVPEAEEVISYGMPGFKYKGKYLVGFAAFSDHLSLFPTSEPVEVMMEKLGAFKLSKGTIQFTLDNPIPEPIIQKLITIRRDSIDGS